MIRQLISKGALRTESGNYASLSLVPDLARPILRNEASVMLREEAEPVRARPSRADRSSAPAGEAGGLFEALRAWRAAEAKAQSVPPYVIFHDSVLRDIAAALPGNLDDLGEIKGVGASKLDRYGKGVLSVIRQNA